MNFLKSKIKYPKLFFLFLCTIAAYILFRAGIFKVIVLSLNHHGYVATFFAGILFTFGFTAPLGVGLLLELSKSINPFVGALIAGIGSLIADLAIFNFLKISLQDEFDSLKMHRIFQNIRNIFKESVSEEIGQYIVWAFAGIIIASPLPDELGISILSGTRINQKAFALIAFILNSIGIYFILSVAEIA